MPTKSVNRITIKRAAIASLLTSWIGSGQGQNDCLFECIREQSKCAQFGIPSRILVYRVGMRSHSVIVFLHLNQTIVRDMARGAKLLQLPRGVSINSPSAEITKFIATNATSSAWWEDMIIHVTDPQPTPKPATNEKPSRPTTRLPDRPA